MEEQNQKQSPFRPPWFCSFRQTVQAFEAEKHSVRVVTRENGHMEREHAEQDQKNASPISNNSTRERIVFSEYLELPRAHQLFPRASFIHSLHLDLENLYARG